MNSKLMIPTRAGFPLLLFLFLVHGLSTNAINITELLSQHSDFSSFSDALSQTQVASAINSRQTITVLALNNGAMSGISGSQDTLKAILNLHVILDYFDQQKLQNMPQKSTVLTTLFQTTGQANGMRGFLNVTVANGGVTFGSAVPGSSLVSSLVKQIASQPYNVSVLQVSSAIVPPGLGGNTNSSSSPPSPPGASSPPASSPGGSPVIPLPPKFGNAPVPSAAKTPAGAPPNASATPPSNAGATPPSGAAGGLPGNATAPSGAAGGNATAPSGAAGGPPANATAPSDGAATSPAGATAPSDAAATPPAGATAPSDAGADSPAGAMPVVPGGVPAGSPPIPAAAGPIADGPLADAPAGGSTPSGGRNCRVLDHAILLIMSIAVIWSTALSI